MCISGRQVTTGMLKYYINSGDKISLTAANDKEEYSIRYTEIIALLVKEVQDLKAEVKQLKENINNENY